MKSTTNDTDLQSLIGESFSSEYDSLEQEQELLAADREAMEFEGYSEFSADLEEAAWNGAQSFNGVLIKKACEHTRCLHFGCQQSTRIGGIEI